MAPNTLFIVGPTASGKSALAMRFAQALDGEIICADSQTIRRELTIGTAKPSKHDQQLVPHHLLNIIGPYDEYSAAQFKADADVAIKEIHKNGHMAIVAGGTGLYVDALFYDYSFDGKAADAALRKRLAEKSVEELQAAIKAKGYTLPTNARNPRHLIRTLESGGMTVLDKHPKARCMIIGINPGRETVRRRIAERVDAIFKQGFMDEVSTIVKKHGLPTRRLDAIAYRIAAEYLDTRDSTNEAFIKQSIVTAEQQFAKRQITWFKRNTHIKWFDSADEAYEYVRKAIKS